MSVGAAASAVAPRRTLILGGVRSGKSRLAERLALASGLALVYVATARAGDEEMVQRIAAHRDRRGSDWRVIEEPLDLAGVITREANPGTCVLVECLTLWLTNLLMDAQVGWADADFERSTSALLAAVDACPGRLILVANESNLGIIPMGELTRRYCDLAGTLHQALAARCDQVVLTVAGLPLALKGPTP